MRSRLPVYFAYYETLHPPPLSFCCASGASLVRFPYGNASCGSAAGGGRILFHSSRSERGRSRNEERHLHGNFGGRRRDDLSGGEPPAHAFGWQDGASEV